MKILNRIAGLIICATFPAGFAKAAEPNIAQIITSAAQRHGVPPRLALAVAKVESGFRCNIGNGGVMQVNPRTARSVGVLGNLRDCHTGAEAGVRYLAAAYRIHPTPCLAASLFNRGLNARPSCSGYALKVMRFL